MRVIGRASNKRKGFGGKCMSGMDWEEMVHVEWTGRTG